DFEHSQGLAHHQHLPSAAFGDRGHSMTAWVMRVAGDLPPAPRMRKRPCRAAVMANPTKFPEIPLYPDEPTWL
ncbi:MAG: hypothetical protein WAV78_40790, partial [Xanthobacteraceae bacterium]